MNAKQRIFLMADLWPAACEFQGWPPNDREHRLAVLSEALRRPIASATEINALEDFDAVKAHLKLLANSLKGALESNDPALGRARRLRKKIIELVRCLNLYGEGDGFARKVIADGTRFAGAERASFAEMPLPRILEALTATPRHARSERTGRLEERPSQLDQVVMTLSRGLNGKKGWRARAGHSVHEMLKAAGLDCGCARCWREACEVKVQSADCESPMAEAEAEAVPAGHEADNNPF